MCILTISFRAGPAFSPSCHPACYPVAGSFLRLALLVDSELHARLTKGKRPRGQLVGRAGDFPIVNFDFGGGPGGGGCVICICGRLGGCP